MPNHSRPYAVLFDLDGTLIDSIPLLLQCVHHAFEGHTGRVPTDEEWVAGVGTPLPKQLEPYCSSPEDVERIVSRYRTHQRAMHDSMTRVFDGVSETLERLQTYGHPMGVVTSKGNDMMMRGLRFTHIDHYMKTLIGCDSCAVHKPDPFPVRLALSELSYEPHEAVFVGDSPHDIRSGNSAGVKTIAALWGPFTREMLEPYEPSYFLHDIRDLPPLVQRIQNAAAV